MASASRKHVGEVRSARDSHIGKHAGEVRLARDPHTGKHAGEVRSVRGLCLLLLVGFGRWDQTGISGF